MNWEHESRAPYAPKCAEMSLRQPGGPTGRKHEEQGPQGRRAAGGWGPARLGGPCSSPTTSFRPYSPNPTGWRPGVSRSIASRRRGQKLAARCPLKPFRLKGRWSLLKRLSHGGVFAKHPQSATDRHAIHQTRSRAEASANRRPRGRRLIRP